MRVGIITLFHNNYNYGAYLQAYALQKAIESLGYEVKIIDYDRLLDRKLNKETFIQKIKKRIIKRYFR